VTLDLDQIPFADIKPNSLLVLRWPQDSDEDRAGLDNVIYALRDQLPESVRVLVLRDETQLCHVDEATMNAAGWFRKAGS
jgi:hypothetical protein